MLDISQKVLLFSAAAISAVGFLSSIILVCLDIYGAKKVDVYAQTNANEKKFVSMHYFLFNLIMVRIGFLFSSRTCSQ